MGHLCLQGAALGCERGGHGGDGVALLGDGFLHGFGGGFRRVGGA